jgi:3-hydroxyisobutyrate dehydrogenase-like beta-hydroxyacid dehydrogenase
MHTASAVGFIGLGNMGFGMARNRVVKGYDVLAYDLAPEPLERLVQPGARRAEDLAQIGRSCERVMKSYDTTWMHRQSG